MKTDEDILSQDQESPAVAGFEKNNDSGLAKLRKEYSSKGIDDENTLDVNPIVVFQKWLDEAIASKVHEPNAMCLATCDITTGSPSARIVLLKGLDDRGFVWYTNYESRKGQELHNVCGCCCCFVLHRS
jgi:pyridoxine/pyridoxamine 5'-phosphate oxidase